MFGTISKGCKSFVQDLVTGFKNGLAGKPFSEKDSDTSDNQYSLSDSPAPSTLGNQVKQQEIDMDKYHKFLDRHIAEENERRTR